MSRGIHAGSFPNGRGANRFVPWKELDFQDGLRGDTRACMSATFLTEFEQPADSWRLLYPRERSICRAPK